MSDKMREEFEVKFPLPSGVAWKGSIGMYEVVDIWKLDQAITISRYNWLWEGWQASRESLVIELPREYELPSEPTFSALTKSVHEQVRRSVEASGVKVKL